MLFTRKKKTSRQIAQELKTICNRFDTPTYTSNTIEHIEYKPMVINALRARSSIEYFRASKLTTR